MSSVETYRILADYHCDALWQRDKDGVYDSVDTAEADLPPDLIHAIESYATVYTATLNEDDPASSGFATELELKLFAAWGRALAHWLSKVLDEPVGLFDELSRTHTIVSEHPHHS